MGPNLKELPLEALFSREDFPWVNRPPPKSCLQLQLSEFFRLPMMHILETDFCISILEISIDLDLMWWQHPHALLLLQLPMSSCYFRLTLCPGSQEILQPDLEESDI